MYHLRGPVISTIMEYHAIPERGRPFVKHPPPNSAESLQSLLFTPKPRAEQLPTSSVCQSVALLFRQRAAGGNGGNERPPALQSPGVSLPEN